MARYEFIDVEKATLNGDGTRRYSVRQMCRWLRVSASGYYEWVSRPASATVQWRERLKPLIVKAFVDSDGRYGYRRVHAQLARWGQHCVNIHRVLYLGARVALSERHAVAVLA